jgi:parallel beta-helix repeat protein
MVFAQCVVPTDGMEITGFMPTFCEGTYNLPNGLIIRESNMFLDCNNSIFIGTKKLFPDESIGLLIDNTEWIRVTNCTFENYNRGIAIKNSSKNIIMYNNFENNYDGMLCGWAWFSDCSLNQIRSNQFKNNDYTGIHMMHAIQNTITDNYFYNNYLSILNQGQTGATYANWFYMSYGNKIINNIFENGDISDEIPLSNTWCENGIGNTYLSGATGPTCPETTGTTTTTTVTTTTTIPSADLENRVSALESFKNKFIQAICSIKYSNYFGFCPPKCPSPYSCKTTCEDDMTKPYCYDRTTYPEYFCSYNKVCCGSAKVTCPK